MMIRRGTVIDIKGAYNMGLDLPDGEVIVESVTTLEENYSIEAGAREQLRIMKEDGYSTSEIEDVEFGQWVVFHYSKYELDKDYFNVVMPIDTFRQLIK